MAVLGLTGTLAACASAPPVPPAPSVSYEQKMTWILQLEDQRLLALPEPPPPEPPPEERRRRRPAPPPPPALREDLALLIRDAEPRVRRRAAIAVGRVGLPEGVALLTPLLADADAEIRQAGAFALGLIGDRAASAALVPLLEDPDPVVRGRAAEALGRMGAEEAGPAIGQMAAGYAAAAVAGRTPDDQEPGDPAAEAFKLGLFALVRLRAYEPLAAAVLDAEGRPIAGWWPIAYALQRIGDPRAVPALRQLAGVKGRYTPAFAARGLGTAKDPAAADVLLPLADPASQPREVVASAIRALGQVGGPKTPARLGALVADQRLEPNLRLEAVNALAGIEAGDQLPVIQDLITDEWPAMRAAAIRAAAAVDPASFTLILSGLDVDRHWLVRAALAEALGGLPPEVALGRVTAFLDDADKRVVPAALRALVRLGAPDAGTTLLAHLQADDFVIREVAAALVGEVKPAGGFEALQAAYATGQVDVAYGARAAALDAMAAYGGDQAVAALREALADKDWAVRLRAASLLRKLDPAADPRAEIRPAPGPPPAPYDDPQLMAPPHSPHVFIETARGTIEFRLAVLDAPQTARSFIALARRGFFNGLPVHRVVPNFVVQGGDPRGDGQGGPGYTIRDEINDRPYLRGTVGMALGGPDTGGSQFFITHSPQPHLDGFYTVFGQVVNGMDVVDQIRVGDLIQRVRVWDGRGWE